jgi:hypothetical protein
MIDVRLNEAFGRARRGIGWMPAAGRLVTRSFVTRTPA